MNSIDRVMENESPIINIDLKVKTINSATQLSLFDNVINTKLKITGDMSLMNVPLTLVARDNDYYRKPDINSITD